jgi:hypothetical protein
MSRYQFNGAGPHHHKVIVGWDNPLETFFLQVWDELAVARLEDPGPSSDGRPREEGDEEPEPLLCAGMVTGEVPSVRALRALVGPFGGIPGEILVRLREDVGRRERPTASQLRMRK